MKFIKRALIYLIVFVLIFGSLVFYNYLKARKNLSSETSQFSINLINPPIVAKVGKPVTFNWSVSSNGNFSTPSTAIFYSPVSSPGALIKTDSPAALGYPYHTPDYFTGTFKLPDHFGRSITFDKPGRVYYRAFSLIGKDYYWTPEYRLTVEQ